MPYLENKGFSVTDHYWLKTGEETWGEVRNGNYSPDCSLGWVLPKKWVKKDGNWYLFKGHKVVRQSICEVLATEIHKRQGRFCYVSYTLTENGCICPNFVTGNKEFIPAIDMIQNVKVPNNLSLYETYIRVCNDLGLDIRPFLEYQIMTDFIISNIDRHMNNFGVIIDNKKITYAPLFDSGNAMFYQGPVLVGKDLLTMEVSSFCKKEVKILSYVKDKSLVDTRLLPSIDEIYNLFCSYEDDERAVRKMMLAYKKKLQYFNDFQNGAKLWSYNYKG